MKKIISWMLVLVWMGALAGCGGFQSETTGPVPTTQAVQQTQPNHQHQYRIETIAPTCEQQGCKRYTCPCGDCYEEDVMPALGHQWSEWQSLAPSGAAERVCATCGGIEKRTTLHWEADHIHIYTEQTLVSATCTAEGSRTYTCACGDHYTEPIPMAAHQERSQVTQPTCTEDGYTTHTCTVCGASRRDSVTQPGGHRWSRWQSAGERKELRTCSGCGRQETRTVHTHSHRASVTAPTCTQGGYTTHTCSCGDHYRDSQTQALGHAWGGWSILQEPTASQEGRQERKCERCGETEKQTMPMLEHTHAYAQTVTREPTCTSEGVRTFSCTCGEGYTEPIPKTDHAYALHHEEAQGRYVVTLVCGCGWSCTDTDAVAAGYGYAEQYWHESHNVPSGGSHTYRWEKHWQETAPARDCWKCSICGHQTDTKPQ